MVLIQPHAFYRREADGPVYVRDREGRQNVYQFDANGRPRPIAPRRRTLGPVYNRVDFTNAVRFVGRVRSQNAMQREWDQAVAGQIETTGWLALPADASSTRREPRQGMDAAMTVLTGAPRSARQYVAWYVLQPGAVGGLDATADWEWCHLQAHSLGGLDDETNVLAAVKGNNSEQLAIENALHMYRREDCFEFKVEGLKHDLGNGQHIANIVRYKIRCTAAGEKLQFFLDGLNAPDPSGIHFGGVHTAVATWANRVLSRMSASPVTKTEQNSIKAYVRERTGAPY